jgi:hypothetical protein
MEPIKPIIAQPMEEDSIIGSEDPEFLLRIISNEHFEKLQKKIKYINEKNPNNTKNISSIIESISFYFDLIKHTYLSEKFKKNKLFTFNNENFEKNQIIICLKFLISKIENVLLKIKNVDRYKRIDLLKLYSDLIQLINIIDPNTSVKFEEKYIDDYYFYLNSINKTDDGIGNNYDNKENKEISFVTNEMNKNIIDQTTDQTTDQKTKNPLLEKLSHTNITSPSIDSSFHTKPKPSKIMSLSDEQMIGGKRNKTMKKCMKKPRKTNKKNVKKSRKTKRSIRR